MLCVRLISMINLEEQKSDSDKIKPSTYIKRMGTTKLCSAYKYWIWLVPWKRSNGFMGHIYTCKTKRNMDSEPRQETSMFSIHIPWYEPDPGYSLKDTSESTSKASQGLFGGPEANWHSTAYNPTAEFFYSYF